MNQLIILISSLKLHRDMLSLIFWFVPIGFFACPLFLLILIVVYEAALRGTIGQDSNTLMKNQPTTREEEER